MHIKHTHQCLRDGKYNNSVSTIFKLLLGMKISFNHRHYITSLLPTADQVVLWN